MTDPKQFTTYWHDLYQEKKGIKYDWQKKDFPNINKCLKYFEKQGGLEQMKLCAEMYLDSDEKFVVERAWNVVDFLTNPGKWLLTHKRITETRKRKEATQKAITENARQKSNKDFTGWDYKKNERRWQKLNVPTFVNMVILEATPNPEKYFKHFLGSQHILKSRHKEAWREVSRALTELVGKERAREMWKNNKNDSILGSIK